MKTLTKPVKSRQSSFHIYGYENEPDGHWAPDPPDTLIIYGDPPTIAWRTKYYTCKSGGSTCPTGDTRQITFVLVP